MLQEKDEEIAFWKQKAARLESQLESVQQSCKARTPDEKDAIISQFEKIMGQIKQQQEAMTHQFEETMRTFDQEQGAVVQEVCILSSHIRVVRWEVDLGIIHDGRLSRSIYDS